MIKLQLDYDDDDHYELSEVQAKRLVNALLDGCTKAAAQEVLARAWDAGWNMCAKGGKAHYNPFGRVK